MKKLIKAYIYSIPKEKQDIKLFYFYIINFCIAVCFQFSWGFYTPSFDSNKINEAISMILGFIVIFSLEIAFVMLALRHMDILEN